MKRITILCVTLLAITACDSHPITRDCFRGGTKDAKEAAKLDKAIRKAMIKKMISAPCGIDVSHHQGFIEWPRVRNDRPDIQFVYVKLTEGASHVDSRGTKNFYGAASVDIPVGGYHYFRMTSGAWEQFEHFKKILDYCIRGQSYVLIPMVDVETADGHPVQEVQDSLLVMLNLLEEAYGKKPMIYGTMRSYNTLLAPDFNDYPLYIGRFGIDEPTVIDGDYTIWQFSERGHIDGIPKSVDLCRFHQGENISDITLWHKTGGLSRQ